MHWTKRMTARPVTRLVVAAALFLVACGGGGGGGGGTPDVTPPGMSDLVNYTLAPPGGGGELLTAAWLENQVAFTGLDASGTYRRSTGSATMAAGSTISLETGALYGPLDITITSRVDWIATGDPTAGAMRVDWDGGYILVTPNPDVNGVAGVDVQLFQNDQPASPVVSFSWDEFDDVEEMPETPDYQRVASFAYSAWQYLFRHVLHVFGALLMVDDAQDDLKAAGGGAVAVDGPLFPPVGGVPGQALIGWFDASADGDPGEGDEFTVQYANWWVDDPLSDSDDLYQGLLTLLDFADSAEPGRLGADARYTGFEERETRPDFTVEDEITFLDGGLNLLVTW